MRDHNKAFCRLVAETFDCPAPVYEFGSYQVEGQEGYANLRAVPRQGVRRLRHAARAGRRPGRGRLGDQPARRLGRDGALHRDVRARLRGPPGVRRGLPDPQAGRACSSSPRPLNFRIHGYPDDYWRMTPNCLRRLMSPYAARVAGYQGHRTFPHSVMALGIKSPAPADVAIRAGRLVAAYQRLAARGQGEPAGRRQAPPRAVAALSLQGRAVPDRRLLLGRLHDRRRRLGWPRPG